MATVEPMRRRFALPRRRDPRRTLARVDDLVGRRPQAVIPVQRRRPHVVLTVCVAELTALVAFVLSGSGVALAALFLAAIALAALGLSNEHRFLVVAGSETAMLSSSVRGVPRAVLGPGPRPASLPRPRGLGVPVQVDGRTWWVDRWSFPALAKANDTVSTPDAGDAGT
jgi:hypothetical protein